MTGLAGIAAVYVALHVAHTVGDHWVQTDYQARAKGAPGWTGRAACTRHVAALLTVKLTTLGLLALVTGWRPDVTALGAGLALDALSHYWADRRTTLARLAVAIGKGPFIALGAPCPGRDDNPGLATGAYALDHAWHVGFLFLAAVIIGGAS